MSVRHIDYLKINPSRLLVVEIRPVVCVIETQSGFARTSKWMNYNHWKELRGLLTDIADQYEEQRYSLKVTEDVKCNKPYTKIGSTVKIGYMFTTYRKCSCHYLMPRDDASWSDSDDEWDGELKDKGGKFTSLVPCGEMLVVSVALLQPQPTTDLQRSTDISNGCKEKQRKGSLSRSFMSPARRIDRQLLKTLDNTIDLTNTISDYFEVSQKQVSSEESSLKFTEDICDENDSSSKSISGKRGESQLKQESTTVSPGRQDAQNHEDSYDNMSLENSSQLPDLTESPQLPDLAEASQLSHFNDASQMPDLNETSQLPDRNDSSQLPDINGSSQLPNLDEGHHLLNPYKYSLLPKLSPLYSNDNLKKSEEHLIFAHSLEIDNKIFDIDIKDESISDISSEGCGEQDVNSIESQSFFPESSDTNVNNENRKNWRISPQIEQKQLSQQNEDNNWALRLSQENEDNIWTSELSQDIKDNSWTSEVSQENKDSSQTPKSLQDCKDSGWISELSKNKDPGLIEDCVSRSCNAKPKCNLKELEKRRDLLSEHYVKEGSFPLPKLIQFSEDLLNEESLKDYSNDSPRRQIEQDHASDKSPSPVIGKEKRTPKKKKCCFSCAASECGSQKRKNSQNTTPKYSRADGYCQSQNHSKKLSFSPEDRVSLQDPTLEPHVSPKRKTRSTQKRKQEMESSIKKVLVKQKVKVRLERLFGGNSESENSEGCVPSERSTSKNLAEYTEEEYVAEPLLSESSDGCISGYSNVPHYEPSQLCSKNDSSHILIRGYKSPIIRKRSQRIKDKVNKARGSSVGVETEIVHQATSEERDHQTDLLLRGSLSAEAKDDTSDSFSLDDTQRIMDEYYSKHRKRKYFRSTTKKAGERIKRYREELEAIIQANKKSDEETNNEEQNIFSSQKEEQSIFSSQKEEQNIFSSQKEEQSIFSSQKEEQSIFSSQKKKIKRKNSDLPKKERKVCKKVNFLPANQSKMTDFIYRKTSKDEKLQKKTDEASVSSPDSKRESEITNAVCRKRKKCKRKQTKDTPHTADTLENSKQNKIHDMESPSTLNGEARAVNGMFYKDDHTRQKDQVDDTADEINTLHFETEDIDGSLDLFDENSAKERPEADIDKDEIPALEYFTFTDRHPTLDSLICVYKRIRNLSYGELQLRLEGSTSYIERVLTGKEKNKRHKLFKCESKMSRGIQLGGYAAEFIYSSFSEDMIELTFDFLQELYGTHLKKMFGDRSLIGKYIWMVMMPTVLIKIVMDEEHLKHDEAENMLKEWSMNSKIKTAVNPDGCFS